MIVDKKWSGFQQDIFKAVGESEDSLLIEAVAGSGKTTTIVQAIQHVPRSKSVVFLAFNKSIATELGRRITSPNAKCMTLHSAGFNAWKRFTGEEPKVDARKTFELMQTLSWPQRKENGGLSKLLGLARQVGLVPGDKMRISGAFVDSFTGNSLPGSHEGALCQGLLGDERENWLALMEEYGIDEEEADVALARRFLRESILKSRKIIDFDDMLFMPVVSGADFEKFDVVFVDEAQDLSGIQRVMIQRMLKPTSRVIAVGDRHQCQPAGTLVRTPDRGRVPIERLKTGDKVVSVDFSHSCFKGAGDRITVSKSCFLGKMIEIYSGEQRSRYTPNHRCVVQCKPLVKRLAMYLMQKGTNFRIGSAQFSSLRTRLCTEKADRLWLLSLHNSKNAACLEEALVALRFGLSERTFISQTADNSGKGLNQPFLDQFWANVAPHFDKALNVLTYYGRELEFPWVSKDTAQAFRPRRPSEVRACNVIEGMLVLHAEKEVHYKKHDWKPIELVVRALYDDFVYSLDVENKHTYIADGIATHNSIYQFRGASSDAMPLLQQEFKCRSLPLSISYRCPKAIVQKAQKWVPHIESAPEAIEGLVVEYPEKWLLMDFKAEDVILCRLTRPLVETAFRLIREKIPCRVLGRDIGAGLLSLVKKSKISLGSRLSLFHDWLVGFYQQESKRLLESHQKAKAGVLGDKVRTLEAFIRDLPPHASIQDLQDSIERLFSDNGIGRLTLSTIHKAKGMEWGRVFILDAHELQPCPWSRPSEFQSEQNLEYVAATRAQKELYYLASEALK